MSKKNVAKREISERNKVIRKNLRFSVSEEIKASEHEKNLVKEFADNLCKEHRIEDTEKIKQLLLHTYQPDRSQYRGEGMTLEDITRFRPSLPRAIDLLGPQFALEIFDSESVEQLDRKISEFEKLANHVPLFSSSMWTELLNDLLFYIEERQDDIVNQTPIQERFRESSWLSDRVVSSFYTTEQERFIQGVIIAFDLKSFEIYKERFPNGVPEDFASKIYQTRVLPLRRKVLDYVMESIGAIIEHPSSAMFEAQKGLSKFGTEEIDFIFGINCRLLKLPEQFDGIQIRCHINRCILNVLQIAMFVEDEFNHKSLENIRAALGVLLPEPRRDGSINPINSNYFYAIAHSGVEPITAKKSIDEALRLFEKLSKSAVATATNSAFQLAEILHLSNQQRETLGNQIALLGEIKRNLRVNIRDLTTPAITNLFSGKTIGGFSDDCSYWVYNNRVHFVFSENQKRLVRYLRDSTEAGQAFVSYEDAMSAIFGSKRDGKNPAEALRNIFRSSKNEDAWGGLIKISKKRLYLDLGYSPKTEPA